MQRRSLTRAERPAAAEYAGGACWIKVTFDSRAAADRAVACSPHILHGYWVSAQPWTGKGLETDAPVPVTHNDDALDPLGVPRPPSDRAATWGSAAMGPQRSGSASRSNSNTLPSGFRVPWSPAESSDTMESSSTLVPGAPATEESASLRSPSTDRLVPGSAGSESAPGTVGNGSTTLRQRTFSHFPDMPMTQMRDASEALLPSPTWLERLLSTLTRSGLVPGDVIGSAVPRKDNGDFDFDNSTFYWRLCYWLDTTLGTDLCGMKEG